MHKGRIHIFFLFSNNCFLVNCDQDRLTTTSLFMKFDGSEWSKGPNVPFFTQGSTVIHIDENTLLLIGGSEDVAIGDPGHTRDTWYVNLSDKSFRPGPPMLSKRARPAAAKMLLNDEVVIVVAGSSRSGWCKYTSSVEILNLSEKNPVWKEGATWYTF